MFQQAYKMGEAVYRKSVDIIENNSGAIVGSVGTGLMVLAQSASAALPTEAATAFTTISGNVTDILAAVWPIAALATGGFVLLRLFKKGANKAV